MTCRSPGCNQSYRHGRELMKHQRMKHHLFCHLCREFFDNYESFMEHIFYETHDTRMQYSKDGLSSPSRSSGNEETNEDDDEEDDYSDSLYYCPYEGCQIEFGFKFIDHLAAHRRRQEHWYCQACELFFNSNEEWDMHNLLNKKVPSTELDKFHPDTGSKPSMVEGSNVAFYGPGYINYTTTRASRMPSSDLPEPSRSTEFSGGESPAETLVGSTDDEDTLYNPYTPYVSRIGSPTTESNSSNDHDSDSEDLYFSNNSSTSSESEPLNPPGSGDEEVGPKTFGCRHCFAMFPNGKTLFVHLTATRHFFSSQYTSSPGRVENESLFRTNWDATPFLCRPCGTRFINVEDLEEHFFNLHANRNFAWMWNYCACGKFFENRWIDVLHHLDSGSCESGIGTGWIDRMIEKGVIDTEWKNSFLETLEKQEQEGTEVETNPSSHESSNNCQWIEAAEDKDTTSTSSASSSSFINFNSSSDGNYTGSDSVKSSSGVSGADERESDPGSGKENANRSHTDTSRDRTQDDSNETWYFVNVDQSAHETVVRIQSASDKDANEENHEEDHDRNEIDHLVNAFKGLFGSLKQRLIHRMR
ncbi:hypothetical protein TWF191_010534 [Orbilia oligospora]|uniref:C2H2-type domain-containing protein n=1 Tax=Orbilia oligospora TaxID=2813651 RepID=A0A7C8UE76_ORBOL|nr:hypothetical protein TWF191_010534 [Orbilia oligospora]